MRTLNKKNIEAMKNEMPLLSEDILKIIIAGNWYYSHNGDVITYTSGVGCKKCYYL